MSDRTAERETGDPPTPEPYDVPRPMAGDGDAERSPVEISWEPRSAERDEPRPAQPRRAVLVAAVVVMLGFLGATWALSSPVGSSPDDDFHLASIWCSPTAPDDACTDLGGSFAAGQTFVEIPVEVGPKWCFAGFPRRSAACVADKEVPGTFVRSLANDGIYPGLYYTTMGVLVTDEPVNSALAVRFASWVSCLTLLGAGWSILPRRHRLMFPVVLSIVAVPHGLFLSASSNPSGVVVAAVSAAWCGAVALLGAPDRRRTLVAGGVLAAATIAAAGSRADGGVYAFVAVLAAVLLTWRPGDVPARRLAATGVIAASGLLVSAVVLSRRLESTGVGDGLARPQIADPPDGSTWFNLLEVPYFLLGNLGTAGIGWLDTEMPRIVSFATITVFFALVFRGIGRTDLAKGLSLLCLLAGLLVLPLYFLWRAGTVVGFEIQPRYVLPLLPVFGFTALWWRRGNSLAGLTAVQISTAFGLLAIAHSAALHRNIRRYVTGTDVTSPDLDTDREWWWDIAIGPNAVWLAGSVAFAGLVAVLGVAVHRLEEPTDGAAPDGEPAPMGEPVDPSTA